MILTLLLLWSMATTQQPSSPGANDLGVIKGKVVDPNGKPVADVVVHAINDDGGPTTGRRYVTTTDANGNFILDQVIPSKKIKIYTYKYSEYYEDATDPFAFHRSKLELPEVAVKPGQTVTGVTVRLMQKAGKLRLNVRDADTKELVHGIYFQLCREGYPDNCLTGSAQSDYECILSLGPRMSIGVEADDGKHVKWQYRDPQTDSPYFTVKSGQTETMNIYLRKK